MWKISHFSIEGKGGGKGVKVQNGEVVSFECKCPSELVTDCSLNLLMLTVSMALRRLPQN